MKFPNVKFFPSWIAASGGDDYYTEVLTGKDRVSSYGKVPLIFRALNLRCNTLNKVPIYIYKARTEVEQYPLEETLPLSDLLWLSEAAVLISGANYFVKLKNGYNIDKGLQWLNPVTVKMKVDQDGKKLFWQEIDGKRFPDATGFLTEEEMLYWSTFNPDNDLGGGVSALSVATGNADLQDYMTTFLGRFFKHGAMPVTMAMLPHNSTDTQVKEVENRFKKILQGVKNAFRVVGVKGEVKFEKLTPELETFDMQNLDNHSINNICWAFDIPKTLLTADSANYATAETEYKNFISNTIEPRCKWYQVRINNFLKEYNYRIEFAPQELPEMKGDEVKKASAF
jgi:HK97 family phage portal protein